MPDAQPTVDKKAVHREEVKDKAVHREQVQDKAIKPASDKERRNA